MNRTIRKRAAFTLIELMVVMGIIALLTAMVMLVAPNAMDKDRARDAATQIQGAIQNARLRAMRDGFPRGVRLIVDDYVGQAPPSAINPNAPSANIFYTSSSYQYIEVPPWLLFTNGLNATAANGGSTPELTISYTIATAPVKSTTTGTTLVYQPGSIAANGGNCRACTISNLSAAQLTQLQTIVNGPPVPPASAAATLGLPTIGWWTQIVPGSYAKASASSCTIQLEVYPDAMLGAASVWSASAGGFTNAATFGIYQAPRPLLGETVMQMPYNTTVDLSDGVSQPSLAQLPGAVTKTGSQLLGYDILFSPSGQLMSPAGVGQVYLWVRDPTKGVVTPGLPANPDTSGGAFCSMCPSASSLGSYIVSQFPQAYATGSTQASPYNTALSRGGEQLLVTIRGSSGGTGVSPIFWPATLGQTPYFYSQSLANSP